MPRAIAFIIYPGFQIIDVAGPLGAFEIASRYRPETYALSVRAGKAGAISSSAGAAMIAQPLGSPATIDTIVVAGGEGMRNVAAHGSLVEFVRRHAATARRTTSVCTGAFVLAEAGVLDGRRATTHWGFAAEFAKRYPKVRVEADRIWVRDGEIWTSAGITAGIDLALAMIADDLGEDIAHSVARQLVVYYRRPSGQSQFSALLELSAATPRFAGLLDWARANLGDALTVERLADRAAMSPRNFARAFTRETGVTPAKAIERLRLEAARTEVEASASSLGRIARDTGFGDPERMRRAFLRSFGQPPQALRRAACLRGDSSRTKLRISLT